MNALSRTYHKKFAPAPVVYDDIQALHKLLRQMRLDDALVRRGWRVEYLYLAEGLPHFRLYRVCGGLMDVYGIVDVRTGDKLPAIRRELATYLYGVGFTPRNCVLLIGCAKTSLDARKRDLPHLFVV